MLSGKGAMSEILPEDPDGESPEKQPFHIEEAIGALAMGLICIISILNVIVRYATDVSFAFTEEYSVFLLVVVTFVGAGVAFTNKGHIAINFFVDRFGPRGQAAFKFFAFLCSAFLFILVIYYGADLALDEYEFGETSPALGYPDWIYTAWLPILSVGILFRIVQAYIKDLRRK